MTWLLICETCEKAAGEIKAIGVLRLPPGNCACCNAPLPSIEGGRLEGAPIPPSEIPALREKLGIPEGPVPEKTGFFLGERI